MFQSVPFPLKSLATKGFSILGNRRLRKLGDALRHDPFNAIILNSAFVQQKTIKNILNQDLCSAFFTSRRNLLEEMDNENDLLTKLMLYECRTYLLSSLKRLDKMNMIVGLETATPFLDNDFFDYSLRTPNNAKISLFNNKCVLRNIASKVLPRENMKMPKSGFGVPISKWFRTDNTLRGFVSDLENDSFMGQLFRKEELNKIIKQHMNEQSDNSEILWLLTSFYLWYIQFSS